jgi:hypothetical protein
MAMYDKLVARHGSGDGGGLSASNGALAGTHPMHAHTRTRSRAHAHAHTVCHCACACVFLWMPHS